MINPETTQDRDMTYALDVEEETETKDILDEKSSDEAHQILEVILQSISSLFRIGILIRKAGPRDRFKRALQVPEFGFPESFDINYVRDK
jgi:hypothetical protein